MLAVLEPERGRTNPSASERLERVPSPFASLHQHGSWFWSPGLHPTSSLCGLGGGRALSHTPESEDERGAVHVGRDPYDAGSLWLPIAGVAGSSRCPGAAVVDRFPAKACRGLYISIIPQLSCHIVTIVADLHYFFTVVANSILTTANVPTRKPICTPTKKIFPCCNFLRNRGLAPYGMAMAHRKCTVSAKCSRQSGSMIPVRDGFRTTLTAGGMEAAAHAELSPSGGVSSRSGSGVGQ